MCCFSPTLLELPLMSCISYTYAIHCSLIVLDWLRARNCIQISQYSQRTQLSFVSTLNYYAGSFLISNSFQKLYARSNWLLCCAKVQPHPRGSQIRCNTSTRWPTLNHIPQAAPYNIRRQDLWAALKSSRCFWQRQARIRSWDTTRYRGQGNGRELCEDDW